MTNSTERMRITSGGNVGIGTSAPAYKFDVQVASNKHWAIAASSTGEASFRAGNDGYAAFAIGEIDASTLRLNSQSGGNVGIGTTSPNAKLNVSGISSGTSIRLDHTSSYSMLYSYINGGSPIALDNESGAFAIYTGGSERMRITSGGELLINTTSDAGDYKLQVNGNMYVNGDMAFGGSQSLKWGSNTYIYGSNNTQIEARVNSNLGWIINSSGNTEFGGSIKTAAPSGGTAKPWKLGEAGVSVGGANTTAVKVEIDGVVYYLLTAYLPEPEPDPAALPSSGPSASYKTYNKPIPVKTTKDVEIDNLKKEIEELKQLIKNK